MSFLMGVDVGSSDCKVVVISADGHVKAHYTQSYPTAHPKNGWAEQNPQDWYQAACAAIRGCLEAGHIDAYQIAGLSIDGPAHNVALLDEHDRILHPTLHWSDLRSKTQAERLEAQCGEHIFEITATRTNPSWTLAQLLWLKENRPEIWKHLRRILVTKDYVRYAMTGIYQTDIYDAIGTQLYDIRANRWSKELCNLLDWDTDILPPVASSTEISGRLQATAARDTGLLSGTPIAVGSGDSVVEAFGIGAATPGDCIVKVGTAANVNLVTAEPHPSPQTITYRHVVDPAWFTIAPTTAGASTMRWFRETFCRHEVEYAAQRDMSVHELIDELASGVPAGCEGLLFHPYLMGERAPYWDSDLRGSFVGVRAHHTLHHFARAVIEGVALSIRDCLQVVEALGQPIRSFRLIGGGSRSLLWQQIIADVLGKPLHKPAVEDAAFGAAMLAGVAVGVFPTMADAIRSCVRTETLLTPDMSQHERYTLYFDLYRSIKQDMTRHNHRLAQIHDSQED